MGNTADLAMVQKTIIDTLHKEGKGAFTPDANDANRANDLHVKSLQRHERQSCGAIRANEAARMARIERFFSRDSRKLKNLN